MVTATVLGSGMTALDGTVVGIALPSMGRDLHLAVSGLQWVTTGYLLTLSGFLLLGGALGDRLGRRRVFVVGAIWFAVASLLCGVAPNAGVLIAARALQGVGGALLMPESLAILQASFRERDRARAIGAWSGLGGAATAIGPFLGGVLITAVSWRLIFFINLPVAALVVWISMRHVPESLDPTVSGRLDVTGAALVTVGLGGITYALVQSPDSGWGSVPVLSTLIIGAIALTVFVLYERQTPHPMLLLSMFRSQQFTGANLETFVVYAALAGALFLLPIQLQQVDRYTPLESGIALLPLTLLLLLLSARSGALATRIGPRLQMSVGPLAIGAAFLLLARVGPNTSYLVDVLPAVVIMGLGLAALVAPLTATVLQAAPVEHAGVASAINNDVARAAGLIAVAVLPAAAGITGTSYLHPLVFSAGFHTAMVISALVTASGGVIAFALIRDPARRVRELAALPASLTHASHCALDAPPLGGRRTADDGALRQPMLTATRPADKV